MWTVEKAEKANGGNGQATSCSMSGSDQIT